jgi:PAS domain S-box-containing protein
MFKTKKSKRSVETSTPIKMWLENLIQGSAENVIHLDANGRITSLNPNARHTTGWGRDRILSITSDEMVFPLKVEDERHTQAGTAATERTPETISQMQEIELAIIEIAKTYVPPAGEGEEKVFFILRDITEEKAADSLRSYFLGNITHEFRTPLSAINASVEVLLEEIENLSKEDLSGLLGSIHLSVSGLQTLIDNLLESISIEAGHFRIHKRPTRLDAVLVDAMRVMQPLLTRRRQQVLIRKPKRLPTILADPTRLTQVLVNLISNASKYSPIGTQIELTLEKIDGKMMRVTIADRGDGILGKDKEQVFHRFIRLGNSDGTQYGIGLGLSVVKAIIEEHCGEIGVEDRRDGGSIFWFKLPINGRQT